MSVTQIKDGSVVVAIGDDLQRFVDGLVARVETSAIKVLRKECDRVASEARAAWYGPKGVNRETGKSGDIRVIETVDIGRGEIRFSVGSTDTRLAGTKPLPVVIHRPGRLSTVLVACTPAAWYAAPEPLRGPWLPGPPKVPQLFRHNPAASDGKFLLTEMVRKPMRAAAKTAAAQIGARRGE